MSVSTALAEPRETRRGRYDPAMVSLALQESLEALTPAERVAVIDFLQRSLVARDTGLTEAEKALVRQRDAELEADPSLGLTWAELDARLQSIWG